MLTLKEFGLGLRWVRVAALALAAAATGAALAGEIKPARDIVLIATRQAPESVADLAERLSGAVVNISTTQKVAAGESVPMPNLPPNSPFREFFEDRQKGGPQRPRKASSLGSGFVVDPGGIIITNNHVIADADEIEANFSDGSNLKAQVIGRDTKTDLAVLRVEPKKPLVAVSFGSSDKLRVGDWVMAIGNPFGLGGSVTVGIVSARNRDISAGPYDDFIQTDAAINRGNSGGPLFNMDGEVVGINTAIISPSGGSIGIGFAIPAATALAVIDQLRQFGETRRGWLGVRIQGVNDEIAESLGLDRARGALVADVTAGGPAEKSGIKAGDVILNFNGRSVAQMKDLPRIVADTPIGREVPVVVLRRGKEETFSVTVGRLEEGEKLAAKSDNGGAPKSSSGETETALGMKLAPMSKELREKFQIGEKVDGVVVTDVTTDGPAAEKRIRAGDVVVEIAQEQVKDPQDVARKLKELEKQGRKTVLVLVAGKDGEMRFLALRIEKKGG